MRKAVMLFFCLTFVVPVLLSQDDVERSQDRGTKLRSMRLDALQLDLAIEDETNFIGLDKWGDNRAGIIKDEKTRAVVAGNVYSSETEQSASKTDADESAYGVYGVWVGETQAVEGDFLFFSGEDDQNVSAGNEKTTGDTNMYNVGYSYSFGNLLLGARVTSMPTDLEIKDKSSSINPMKADPTETLYGIGVGYIIPLNENASVTIGANFDLAQVKGDMTGQISGDLDEDGIDEVIDIKKGLGVDGNAYGLQGIFAFNDIVRLGLRYSSVSMDDEVTQAVSGVLSSYGPFDLTSKDKKEQEESEFGIRLLSKFPDYPLNVGLEYFSSIEEETETGTSGATSGRKTGYEKTEMADTGIGVAYKFLEEKLIAGLEFHTTSLEEWEGLDADDDDIIDTTSKVETDGTRYSLGIEYLFLENLAGRISYGIGKDTQKQSGQTDIKTDENILGLGIGYTWVDKGKVDLYYFNESTEDDQKPFKEETSGNSFGLLVTLYF